MSYRLNDARQELFAQEIARGASPLVAYVRAGYTRRGRPGSIAAERFSANKQVRLRVAELTKAAVRPANASTADITKLGIMIKRLEEARELAMLKMQPAPAVYAIIAMARILGMMGREELTSPNVAPFFKSDTEAARRVAFLLKLGGVEISGGEDSEKDMQEP